MISHVTAVRESKNKLPGSVDGDFDRSEIPEGLFDVFFRLYFFGKKRDVRPIGALLTFLSLLSERLYYLETLELESGWRARLNCHRYRPALKNESVLVVDVERGS